MPPFYEIVLYDVPLNFGSDDSLTAKMALQYSDFLSARRILKFPDRDPTTLVRVRVSSRSCQTKMLQKGCKIDFRWFATQRSRTRDTMRRCYNCQQITINHTASQCPNQTRCAKCAANHSDKECRSTVVKCANCEEAHSADSRKCQHWIQQSQHRNRHCGSVVTVEMKSYFDSLKETVTCQIDRVLAKMDNMTSNIIDMKNCVTSLLQIMPQNMPLCVPHQPDEVSAPDLNREEPNKPTGDDDHLVSPPRCAPTNSDVRDPQTPTCDNHPGCSPASALTPASPVSASLPSVSNCTVNSDLVNTNENKINGKSNLPSDTIIVDATKPTDTAAPECENDTSVTSPWNHSYDPVWKKFQSSIWEQAETELLRRMHGNPYAGNVCFRYSEGTIGKCIDAYTMGNGFYFLSPCNFSVKSIKNLKPGEITCCPFHHLAAEIRDGVDKTDPLNH